MIQFALLLVSATTLIAVIVAAVRDVDHRRYWTVCACFIFAGFACWIAFAAIGSEVDAQGVLHEPFALVPVGMLMVVIGVIGSLVRGTMALCRSQSQGTK
ncbi:DUF3955 domain-containing protein [Pandoraea commovens]|uniref:DUF3955 domain-containing protein n=1 Tax=Pandoraea commovens TaxID=2508289 RepID=A0ABY5QID5_9BURK|nr:DUF3955 domain-containing protein [Pandoraea commovens]UVA80547.1 DUF3955 domain-containing protein [Pandoraea commovens]